jgi:bacillithiol system protein YtxJ
MGLFDKMFRTAREISKEEINPISWNDLTTTSEVDNIVQSASKKRPQIIFKHSTRCGISKMALKQFESDYDLPSSQADAYYLDLLNHREVSAYIAEELNVQHQSPQVIVIADGNVIHTESHHGISASKLKNLLEE